MVSKERAKKEKAKQAQIKATENKSDDQKALDKERNRLSQQKHRDKLLDEDDDIIKDKVFNNKFNFIKYIFDLLTKH